MHRRIDVGFNRVFFKIFWCRVWISSVLGPLLGGVFPGNVLLRSTREDSIDVFNRKTTSLGAGEYHHTLSFQPCKPTIFRPAVSVSTS
jgi:hypothetical protein